MDTLEYSFVLRNLKTREMENVTVPEDGPCRFCGGRCEMNYPVPEGYADHWCSNCGGNYHKSDDGSSRCKCFKHKVAFPGWQRRGVKLPYGGQAYLEATGTNWTGYFDNLFTEYRDVDPVRDMASFYLAEWLLVQTLVEPWLTDSAQMVKLLDGIRTYRDDLVSLLDTCFRKYVGMAVAGEARHHKRIRHNGNDNLPINSSSREGVWANWLQLQPLIGPEAYKDLEEIHMDFPEANGYGGRRWALAAKMMYRRETGMFTPMLFVDRVFSLQHNSGSLLSKVQWPIKNRCKWSVNTGSPVPVDDIPENEHNLNNCYLSTHFVGDSAHNTYLPGLLLCCDPKLERKFNSFWSLRNKLLAKQGLEPQPVPTWHCMATKVIKGINCGHDGCSLCSNNASAVHVCANGTNYMIIQAPLKLVHLIAPHEFVEEEREEADATHMFVPCFASDEDGEPLFTDADMEDEFA